MDIELDQREIDNLSIFIENHIDMAFSIHRAEIIKDVFNKLPDSANSNMTQKELEEDFY